MFTLEQPSMALNDTRLDVTVSMAVTRTVLPDESISSILGAVVTEAKSQPGGKFKNLVLNCHGKPGELKMGVGIDRNLTGRFSMLAPNGKPMVETIYLRSCLVARIDGAGSQTDGNLFCCEIAKSAKCIVIASTMEQTTFYTNSNKRPMPFGQLDQFEGTTLFYGPEGNVWLSQTNPGWSKWIPVE